MDAQNRSFRYGDGLFETLRVQQEQILFWQYHQERIQLGFKIVHFELPNALFFKQLEQEIIHQISSTQQRNASFRVRVTFFRCKGGLYAPQSHQFEYLIELQTLDNQEYSLNKEGLKIGIVPHLKAAQDALANCKTTSALRYVLAAQYGQEQAWNDALLLNHEGFLAEATSSNVFIVHNNILYTPSLNQGCVMGTMRRVVLELAKQQGIPTQETNISFQQLQTANEIWLTNVIVGIRWVAYLADNFAPQRYQCSLAQHFLGVLNNYLKP